MPTRRVYLSFSEGDSSANHTALYRARLDGTRSVDGRVIYRAAPEKAGPGHPGARIAFLPDSTLLLTIGDGYDYRDDAQHLGSALGKVVRLDRDGRPPSDNPFTLRAGARHEIWSYGHRNAQGLLVDARQHRVGARARPQGGDEINRVRAGLNYGWPRTSHGVDCTGELISKEQTAEDIETGAGLGAVHRTLGLRALPLPLYRRRRRERAGVPASSRRTYLVAPAPEARLRKVIE